MQVGKNILQFRPGYINERCSIKLKDEEAEIEVTGIRLDK